MFFEYILTLQGPTNTEIGSHQNPVWSKKTGTCNQWKQIYLRLPG